MRSPLSRTGLVLALVLPLLGSSLLGCDDGRERDHGGGSEQNGGPNRDSGHPVDQGGEPLDARVDQGVGGEHDLSPDLGSPEDLSVNTDARVRSDLEADAGAANDLHPAEDLGSQEPRDSGAQSDLSADDAGGDPDLSAQDAGGEPVCVFSIPAPADAPRVVLIGHLFGEEPADPGTELRTLLLDVEGRLSEGARFDIGLQASRLAFLPSGRGALALGEDGELASLRVEGPDLLEMVDQVHLPSASYGDLVLSQGGRRIFVVGSNSTLEGGVSTVLLGCDGSLELQDEAFFPLRLSDSLVLLPGEQRALLRGGQAVFDPVDDDDLRLLELGPEGPEQLRAFDIWDDFINTPRIALSPAGDLLLIPNDSVFSEEFAQLSVLRVDGLQIEEEQRLEDLPDPREPLFSPDGATVLLTLGEPGRVVVFSVGEQGLEEVARIRGIGLADQMAMVPRGPLEGLVLLPSIDPQGGPNLAMLRIEGPGQVRDLGQYELGGGIRNIPGAVAVAP